MDKEDIIKQNNAILEALNIQTAALGQLLQQTVLHSSPVERNKQQWHGSVEFDTFDEVKEDFKSYKERLENFFELKDITGNSKEVQSIKAKFLINALGSKYYKLLSNLTSPDLPSQKTYEELIKILEHQLCPRLNVQSERHKFLSRKQKPEETISQYLVALKELGRTSNWTCQNEKCGKTVDSIIQAQFIRGLKDVYIREQLLLLQGEDLDFKKTVDTALSIETAKTQNLIYENTNSEVHKVFNSKEIFSAKQNTPYKRKRRSIIDQLNLRGLCLCCGKSDHKTPECKSKRNLRCIICKREGHIAKVCISGRLREVKEVEEPETSEHIFDQEFECNQVTYSNNQTDEPFIATVKIGGSLQKFEVDSGSRVSIISLNDFTKLNLNNKIDIKPSEIKFRTYTHDIFEPIGIARVPIAYKNIHCHGNLFIVKQNYTPLLGREWIRKLNINLENVHKINSLETLDQKRIECIKDELFSKYKDVFDSSVGLIPNIRCTLKLKDGAKPIFMKPRPVPYSLLKKTKSEIDLMVDQGILEKTNHSEWGTPLVIVPKPDNSVRVCADYRVTLNPQLQDTHYPIPRIEDLFNKLNGGKFYCVLDLYKAYLHVALDDESQKLATVSTPWGTYKAKRLFMGISNAPKEFHKIIDQITSDLEGTIAYFDDFLIQGDSFEECLTRLEQCLKTLRKYGLHVNKSKCKFFLPEITYLGHKISAQGLSKCSNKIDALIKSRPPKNTDEVRSFLGLAMYYAKFIPNASSILHPLNNLLKKGVKFYWDKRCQNAFQQIKDEIASDRILTPFDTELPVTLATDASPYGLSAVLSHSINGKERPIAFASRSLTKSESAYSQLDREATAVYWAFKKFYHYLLGRRFLLIVDNKPLQQIFNPNKSMPVISAHRLLRYAQFLSGFDYEIKHRPAKEHQHVDYFSRNPLPLDVKFLNFQEDSYKFNEITLNTISDTSIITPELIQMETDKDAELSLLKQNLLHGKLKNPEFTLHLGIIMRGPRVYIPAILRPAILKELHSSHIGIVKMKAIARSLCYWPGIDGEIECLVQSCIQCAEVKKNPVKVPHHSWDEPKENWQRIHIDYAGPYKGQYFFVLIDAKSKWLEITMSPKPPTSSSTIKVLDVLFSRHGLPYTIVSDNAAIFKSEEFCNYCKLHGIGQKFCAPNHPATNGIAERAVQNLKQKLNAMAEDKGDLRDKLNLFLLKYRSTPLAIGKTPSELYMNRQLRTKLHMIKPPEDIRKRREDMVRIRHLNPGDRVQSRNYTGSKQWKFGTVKERLGKLHYMIELDGGQIIKRHINQLNKTLVPVSDGLAVRLRGGDTCPQTLQAPNSVLRPQALQAPNSELQPLLRRSNRMRKPVRR